MSLQIWLPLTKDLRNQGLSNVTVTNNGATFNSAGKLGGCYSFDGSDDFISLNGSVLYDIIKGGSTPFSIAMWVYRADSTRAILFGDYSLSGGIGFNVELSTAHNLRFYWNGSPDVNTSAACTLNTWSHVAIVYDGTKICFYVNGSLNHTYTVTLSTKTKTTGLYYIGRDYRTGSTAFNGKLNDFRIYDHALSQIEVKELAKGLILHYPLNRQGWGQENLASRYVTCGGNNPNNQATAGRTNFYGDYGIIIPTTESADTYFSIWYNTPLESGKTYTLSAQVSGLLNGSYYNFPLFAQNNSSMGLFKIDHNGLVSLTFTMNYTGTIATYTIDNKTHYRMFMDDISRSIASGQGPITITNIKLENGEQRTPWCPNSSDALATTMGLNSTIEYDCSGFCNNGTKTGTFTWTSDTPKYAVSQDCIGTNYIHLTPPSTEIQTMAVWVNWKTIPSGQSVILVDNGSGIGLGLYSGGILCSTSGAGSSYAYSKSNLVANTWYHFVVVKTGTTTRKLYINGVEQTATSNSSNWSYSVNQLQLGKRSTTSDGFIGKLSDFRAYATALSADDVKSLYQNCATIDPDGTIRGQIRS